jgi:hypothetical protein
MGAHEAWLNLVSRRDLLRCAAVGVAGAMLPGALGREAPRGKAKSVIVLWMAGGLTHIDSFDPKPSAPAEVSGGLRAIATSTPGVRFCETMPHMARQAHRVTVLRSFVASTDDHLIAQAYGLSGRKVTAATIMAEPNVGAIVSKLRGGRNGLPGYIAVPGTTRPGPPPYNLFTGAWLGREYGPFCSGGQPRNDDFTAGVKEASEEDFNRQGLTPPPDLTAKRLGGRQGLRGRLERGLSELEKARAGGVLSRQYGTAFKMLLSPNVRRAFDLGRESGRVREKYGQTKIGQRCLLARRLVEAGARFVLVDYGYDPEFGNLWDNHNAPVQNHPPLMKMVREPYHLAGTDRAFAALLDDLATRGLLDETLVLFLTDFGRTPKINSNGGRDHWGKAGSLFFAGAGVRGGQVIGSTDGHAAHVRGPASSPGDVAATVYRAMGVPPDTLLRDRQGRPLPLCEGAPIEGVFA